MSKPKIHITPRPKGWAVKKEGTEKAAVIKPTQVDAIKQGQKMAKDQKTELVIHGRDNKIRDRESYGNDPCPPKDKKH